MKWSLITAIPALAACLATSPFRAQQIGCRPADAYAERGVAYLRDLVTSTRPSAATLRTRLHVDATDANQVYRVTIDSVCVLASEARALALGKLYDGQPAHVYRMGTQYVADKPAPRGYSAMVVLDSLFREVGWLGR